MTGSKCVPLLFSHSWSNSANSIRVHVFKLYSALSLARMALTDVWAVLLPGLRLMPVEGKPRSLRVWYRFAGRLLAVR